MGSGDSGDISTTYGVLCHRQYSDRVRDALLYNNSFNWLQLSSSQCSDSQQSISQTSKCINIPTSDHKGPRKARSGYSLFVIQNATSPGYLPPMARKQISWAGRLKYQCNFSNINIGSDGDGDTTTYKHLIIEIWKELSKTYNATNVYRVDVQPKSYSSEIITAFITHINEKLKDKINLSLSAAKATHVVNIVIQSSTTDVQATSSSDSTQQSPIQAALSQSI